MQHIPDLYADIDLQMLKRKVQALESATTNPKREWVGLTDEEIISSSKFFDYMTNEELIDAVRELETKLKDKNNG